MDRKNGIAPVAAVLVAASLGASSGLYIKGLGLSSFALSALRMGVPFVAIAPFVAAGGRLLGEKTERRRLALASCLNAVRMLLFVMAYKLTAVGNAVVLLYLWPIFALLVDCVRFRRRPAPSQIALLALAFGGVVMMNLHRDFALGSADLLGSACMVASAFLFSLTAVIFKRALATVAEIDALYFQNAAGAVVFLPFLIAELGNASPTDLALGLLYGLLVGLVGFGLFFFAMKRLPLFRYSALAFSEAPIAVALGVAVLGESFAVNQAAGAAMILAASFISQRARTAA